MTIGRNDPCPCGSGKKFKKCCIDKPEFQTPNQVGQSSELGNLLNQSEPAMLDNNEEKALKIGTQFWQKIVALDLNEQMFDSLTRHSTAYGVDNFAFMNWLGDYQMVLANAMYRDREMAEHLMDFIDESLVRFPRILEENRPSFLASKGDALFLMNRIEDGNALFAALQQQYPDDAWPLIWWGDQFDPAFKWAHADDSRAEELYRQAQMVDPREEAVSERLQGLAEWRQSQS